MSNDQYAWLKNYEHNSSWQYNPLPRPLYDLLDNAAVQHKDKPGMDFMGKVTTWGQFGAQVNTLACGLRDLGAAKGTKIGIFLPNGPYFLIAFFAILKTGATVVNYNPLYAEKELQHQIEDSETDFLVTANLQLLHEKADVMLEKTRLKKVIYFKFAKFLPFPKSVLFPIVKSKDVAKVQSSEKILWADDIMQNDGNIVPPEIDPENDLAVLQYTGGTTGVPKGAMLTHMNLLANAEQCLRCFPKDVMQGEQKRMLAVLPFFHVFAMTVTMNLAVMAGMEMLTIPRFDLDQALSLMNKRKPDYMAGVPAIFNAINNHKKLESYDLSNLKFALSGGAPLPIEVKKTFEERIPTASVVEGYGLSESSPVTHVNPPQGTNIPGSIGQPLPGTLVQVVDREDKTTILPIGERGELCIIGPQVMKGYYNKPDETADTLQETPDGMRLHTGDVAIMDENGYFYIVDRIKDMIITNGYNVYPRNIEEGIYQHDAVEECIVAGLPDDNRGEIVKAWIKLKDGHSLPEAELRAFLKDKLSAMEMPKKIEFRDEELPKTMIGKLSRKDIVAEELGKGI